MRYFFIPAVLISGLLANTSAVAQDSRYSNNWSNPDRPAAALPTQGRSAALNELLKELKGLVGEAEQMRAADPRFLRDLRRLARRYSWPWSQLVAIDDFTDGNYTKNPRWTVISGKFQVGYDGLVTRFSKRRLQARTTGDNREQSRNDRDVGRDLLGSIFRELSRNDRSRREQEPSRPAHIQNSTEAKIELRQSIPNSFALQVVLRARDVTGGELRFGLGQGKAGNGYYLVYTPGEWSPISLVRSGARGEAVIEGSSTKVKLDDGADHTILITRSRRGSMRVSLDGKQLFQVRDRTFKSAFDRFVMINRGGIYTVRSVSIHGAPKVKKRR
jgi:hypothetical protein